MLRTLLQMCEEGADQEVLPRLERFQNLFVEKFAAARTQHAEEIGKNYFAMSVKVCWCARGSG